MWKNNHELFVIVNSENQRIPYSAWIKAGNNLEFTYPDEILLDGTQYLLESSVNNSVITVTSPDNIIANYIPHQTFLAFHCLPN